MANTFEKHDQRWVIVILLKKVTNMYFEVNIA